MEIISFTFSSSDTSLYDFNVFFLLLFHVYHFEIRNNSEYIPDFASNIDILYKLLAE